jgi:hypothetical protein
MKVALIGPPQSGKSTLFRAVTGREPNPAAMDQEQIGSVKVPDRRLDWLADHYKPKKYTEAAIDFIDIPGFSLADDHGRAELKRHLPTIRQADALVAVVRAFENDSVAAYRNRIDPQGNLDELHTELIFADLEAVSNRIEKLEKSANKPTKTADQDKRELAVLLRCREVLEEERPISEAFQTEEEARLVKSFAFVTQCPMVAIINVSEAQAAAPPDFDHLTAHAVLSLCAEAEEQIAGLDEADRLAFIEDLGVSEPARPRLIQACYEATGLISFLTAGEDEVRAWPILRNSTAVEAAGKIHSDIAKGFIRAETVAFDDLQAAGDMKAAKAAGKVRLEGKTYIVQDGDLINFRFNV